MNALIIQWDSLVSTVLNAITTLQGNQSCINPSYTVAEADEPVYRSVWGREIKLRVRGYYSIPEPFNAVW